MNISFGILSSDDSENLDLITQSIIDQKIPYFEIINVGPKRIDGHNVTNIFSQELEERQWITKKKNLITKMAKYDWIVMLKDYIILEHGWYKETCEFLKNNNADIIMNVIINNRRRRCIDWVWNNPNLKEGRNVNYKITNHPKMFIPGAFVCGKRSVLSKIMFDEKIVGLNRQSDVEWSNRVLKEFTYKFNQNAVCKIFTKRGFKYKVFRMPCKCVLCKN
jgi:hypothetical protein